MTTLSAEPAPQTSVERFKIVDLAATDARSASTAGDFAADVRDGLTSRPNQLFPKYFYDEFGSRLFDCICLLPEYYLTRAESEILTRHADEIVARAFRHGGGDGLTLIELGSGSAQKTRLIIEALLRQQRQLLYRPVDISSTALVASVRLLLESYPALRVAGYAGDYENVLRQMGAPNDTASDSSPKLVLFLGSNIGNFDEREAEAFLRSLRRVMRTNDSLLLGADLKKEARVLEAAYDDALGVTAAFNLNLLARINRELGGDFDLRAFKHRAPYNENAGRVEMYLESTRAQEVRLAHLDLRLRFAAGERVHTENSHKYDSAGLTALAARTGFRCVHTWYDEAARFSSNLFVAVDGGHRSA
ncbi:MAG TPA: L-histidine N(alpha)-methyltransferase, partial [Pyrinomonadaceae bacterium]|nr:L-histidine N(alpha)-methyltransferase [Pyrinomonadaceae bacterium]